MEDHEPKRARTELAMKPVSPEVQNKLSKIADDSGRTNGCRIPFRFIESSKIPANPPLKKILFRKGETQLKLYLTLLTKATAPSPRSSYGGNGYTTKILLNDMAFSLGFKEEEIVNPGEDSAKRRMERALQSLKKANLIEYKNNNFPQKEILLLSPDGSGERWLPEKIRTNEKRWIVVPIEMWSYGWIVRLPASAIAIFLILKSQGFETNSDDEDRNPHPFTISGHKKREFGLSDATWTRGVKILKESGLLKIERGQFNVDEIYRTRDSYILQMDKLKDANFIYDLDQRLSITS